MARKNLDSRSGLGLYLGDLGLYTDLAINTQILKVYIAHQTTGSHFLFGLKVVWISDIETPAVYAEPEPFVDF